MTDDVFDGIPISSFVDFASYHLRAAQYLALHAYDIESAGDKEKESDGRSAVLGSIASAVSFLEASINQLFLIKKHDVLPESELVYKGLSLHTEATLHQLWNSGVESLSILDKYSLVLAGCHKPPFDRGHNPYQDADHLIGLRNTVTHFKDGWRDAKEPHRIERRLKNKFTENMLLKGMPRLPFFPARCLSYGCAKWACQTAKNFSDEFFHVMGITPMYAGATFLNVKWPT